MKINRNASILAGMCALMFAAAACNLPSKLPPATPAHTAASIPITGATTAPTITETATDPPVPGNPTESPTETLTPSVTPNVITITATANGSLGILRGPSIFYNTLGYLKNGEISTAIARNSNGSWLYIAIPDYPSIFGWVYADSQYSSIQGNVNSLGLKSFDSPVPAFIRNCTFHPMMIQPGGILLQPQTDPKYNKLQFPPDNYTAYDQSVSGNPQVLAIPLKEGVSVDIHKDGLKNTYACP